MAEEESEAELPADDEGGGEGWLVSYADLMTLLFATFVVLYALRPEGQSKSVLGVTSSIRESFIEIPDEIPTEQKKGPIKKGKSLLIHFKADSFIPPKIKRYRQTITYLSMIDNDVDKIKSLIKSVAGKKVETKSPGQDSENAIVEKEKDGFRLRMLATQLYRPGEYEIDPAMKSKLLAIGKMLAGLNRKIIIEGHTDDRNPTAMTNWELSTLRATYLTRFFIENTGMKPELVSASGYADTRPIAQNNSSEGRKLNRRIEIRVEQ